MSNSVLLLRQLQLVRMHPVEFGPGLIQTDNDPQLIGKARRQ